MKKQPIQFALLTLGLLPIMIAPAFVGLRVGGNQNAAWGFPFALIIPYVMVFCWITVRRFNRHSVFRKFPFRGSLWIGSAFGAAFGSLFAIGLIFGLASTNWPESQAETAAIFLGGTIVACACGGLSGSVIGMVAGGVYCYARSLREHFTGESTIRPGQASFKKTVRQSSPKTTSSLSELL